MNTYVDKTQAGKHLRAANTMFQKQSSSKLAFQFMDNRPETIAQRKLQQISDNSPQAKHAAQLQAMADDYFAPQQSPMQKKEHHTGLPESLKSGIERLSNYSMDDVNVYYNSSKPAQLNAHAYTEGTTVYLASGQEKHLPHEAWHVVQQKQGRVQPTRKVNGSSVNDDIRLEHEAGEMGARAMQGRFADRSDTNLAKKSGAPAKPVAQRMINLAIDGNNIVYTHQDAKRPSGCLPGGSQGDHTTPFTSLQDQIANAIEEVTLADAWTNLADTLAVYKTLPGWGESKSFTRTTFGNYVEGLIKTGGDINALQSAVNQLLALRNQIALTSLPKGGHGNAEGKWAGSLQYQERKFQLGQTPALSKTGVMDYMWKAFDHGRVNQLGDTNRDKIIRQHAITMADAYPQLNASLGIDAAAIQGHYAAHNWQTYDPG